MYSLNRQRRKGLRATRDYKKRKVLPYMPAILMHAVAGKRPSRPLRPPKQGDSKKERLPLLWNGSSQGLLLPLIDTHLKQSIAKPDIIKQKQTVDKHN